MGVEGSLQQKKAEALVHYSYVASDRKFMLLDIQGCGLKLFDPEVASQEVNLFNVGNLNEEAIARFLQAHKCSQYCQVFLKEDV